MIHASAAPKIRSRESNSHLQRPFHGSKTGPNSRHGRTDRHARHTSRISPFSPSEWPFGSERAHRHADSTTCPPSPCSATRSYNPPFRRLHGTTQDATQPEHTRHRRAPAPTYDAHLDADVSQSRGHRLPCSPSIVSTGRSTTTHTR